MHLQCIYCKYSTTLWQKLMISCKYECAGEVIVVNDSFLLGCIGFDDFNVYLLAFQLLTLYLL